MAYATKYHEDSDADDEFERSVLSPTLPPDYENSPTSSGPLSTEHTPTTFTHSRDSKSSPAGMIMEWSEEQVADFISDLGLEQYADTFAGKWDDIPSVLLCYADFSAQRRSSRAMYWPLYNTQSSRKWVSPVLGIV
jgi:hypothetical protein